MLVFAFSSSPATPRLHPPPPSLPLVCPVPSSTLARALPSWIFLLWLSSGGEAEITTPAAAPPAMFPRRTIHTLPSPFSRHSFLERLAPALADRLPQVLNFFFVRRLVEAGLECLGFEAGWFESARWFLTVEQP